MTTTKRTERTTQPTTAPTTAPTSGDARTLIAMHMENPSAYTGDVFLAYTKGSGGTPGGGAGRVPVEPYDTLEDRLDEHLQEKAPSGGTFVVRLRTVAQQWATPQCLHVVPALDDEDDPDDEDDEDLDELVAKAVARAFEKHAAAMPPVPGAPAQAYAYAPVDPASRLIEHVQNENRRLLADLDSARKAEASSYADGYKKGFDDGNAAGKKNSSSTLWDDPKGVADLARELRGVFGDRKGAAKGDGKPDSTTTSVLDVVSFAFRQGWAPAFAVETFKTIRGAAMIKAVAERAEALVELVRTSDNTKEWATTENGSAWLTGLREELVKAAA